MWVLHYTTVDIMTAKGLMLFYLVVVATLYHKAPLAAADVPAPQIWPTQFHALLFQNFSGQLGVMDLWYDWTRGLNLHIITNQLEGRSTYDVEWTNGTSFFYELDGRTCRSVAVGVGILRPDWLHDAEYLGVQEVDGFTCNVWEKLDFITYYEDVETKRPVKWLFYTGRQVHVITFDDGVAIPEGRWQAPAYCFKDGLHVMSSKSDLLQERRQKLPVWNEQKQWLLSGAMSA